MYSYSWITDYGCIAGMYRLSLFYGDDINTRGWIGVMSTLLERERERGRGGSTHSSLKAVRPKLVIVTLIQGALDHVLSRVMEHHLIMADVVVRH